MLVHWAGSYPEHRLVRFQLLQYPFQKEVIRITNFNPKKVIHRCSSLIDLTLIACYLLIFLYGGYGLYDAYSVFNGAQDRSSLKFKPEAGQVLNGELKDNVAWLTMDDSPIDYPIMQGANNTEYLSTDPYGNYSLSGSIFVDSRNSGDFSDDYTLIYGHHMEGDGMFGALDRWKDESYYRSHQTGTLTTRNACYSLQVIALGQCSATVEEIFQPTDVSATSSFRCIDTITTYRTEGVEPTHVVALSTCQYPATDNRTILFCEMKLEYMDESIDIDKTEEEALNENEARFGDKIFRNVVPLEPNVAFIDSVLQLIGVE